MLKRGRRRQFSVHVPARQAERLTDVNRFVRDVVGDRLESGAKIDLSYVPDQRVIGYKGIKAIADVLSRPEFPFDVTVDLSRQNIGNNGARYLLQVLNRNNYPKGLKLILARNHRITDVKLLTEIYKKLGVNEPIHSENFAAEGDRDPSYVGRGELASLLGKESDEVNGVELKPLFRN